MDPLITLTDLKAAAGIPNPSAANPIDAKFTLALNAASTLIRAYTGLRFEAASGSISSVRQFEYDGSGYLDIDEVQNVSAITHTAGYTGSLTQSLTSDEWVGYPLNFPVKLWLTLPRGIYGRGISPEMGFTYNLDTYSGYGAGAFKPTLVSVTGVWGWPEIPADVQQAAIWTAMSIAESPRPYTQESIEGYSRTRGAGVVHDAIPERAQLALLPYIIPQV
jgi:hypothetical protein